MLVDMSHTFDTIPETSLFELFLKCGCDDDEGRLLGLLLSNTKLSIYSS